MDIRQLVFADEPPPPQPRSFWVVRLLITGLFAGVAAAAQIVDFPINFELVKAFHFAASPAHPDEPPSVIVPNQLEDAQPRGVSSSNVSPQATRFAGASPSLDSRFDTSTLNDEDDRAKLDALHWGGIPNALDWGVILDALHWGAKLGAHYWRLIVVVLLCPVLALIVRRKGSTAWRACVRRVNVVNRAVNELRRQPRRRTRFRRGKLFDVESRSWLECTICDRSVQGAKIRWSSRSRLSTRFASS